MTFGLMYGLYSRAASNQERPMMAHVRYSNFLFRRVIWHLLLALGPKSEIKPRLDRSNQTQRNCIAVGITNSRNFLEFSLKKDEQKSLSIIWQRSFSFDHALISRKKKKIRLFPIISISQKFFSIFFLILEKIGIDEKVICYHNISN